MTHLVPAADAASSGSGVLILYALLILLLLWFMLRTRSRQRKAVAEQQAEAAAVAVGDRVVLTSGLIGTVRHLDDTLVGLEIAPGVVADIDRRALLGLAAKHVPGTPEKEQ